MSIHSKDSESRIGHFNPIADTAECPRRHFVHSVHELVTARRKVFSRVLWGPDEESRRVNTQNTSRDRSWDMEFPPKDWG